MLYSQLLPLCYFFKGEVMCPLEYDRKNEGKLWFAEKMICEHLSELVDDANPRVSFAKAVAAYVMETYFEKCPELRFKFI